MRVLVIGASSFIASALRHAPQSAAWDYRDARTWFGTHPAPHPSTAADDARALAMADVIINCAFDARLKQAPYDPTRDLDVRLAEQLRKHGHGRYVLLSSRLAYGAPAPDGRLTEHMTARPTHPYGLAKLEAERRVQAILGERLTVLRLSNIFGFEYQPGRRNFFAMALGSLHRHGRIYFDMSPFVERDFLPVEILAAWLPALLQRLRPGLFNLGAGHGTPTGRIAQWLIEGYGGGELLVTDLREQDPFWLDMGASSEAFGLCGITPTVVRAHCLALGRRLRSVDRAERDA